MSACDDPTIQAQIYAYADKYGIDRGIALAQMRQESGCNPNAVSSQGAQGIAQFIPGTWNQYGSGSPFDIGSALDAWGQYMSHLLSKFGGDYRLALAGYHSGEGSAVAALNNPVGNPRTNNYVASIIGAFTGNGGSDTTGGPGGAASPNVLLIAAVALAAYFLLVR